MTGQACPAGPDRAAGRGRDGTNEIVRRTGASKPTVILWKKRYAAEGIGGWRTGPGRAGRGGPIMWRWCWPRWSRRRPGWA
jgi:hypothetical protein